MKDELTQGICFECGEPADYDYHVVPQSRGGKRTVALCRECLVSALMVPIGDFAVYDHPNTDAWGKSLKAPQVLAIRRAFASGVQQATLARKYNVSKPTIHNIVRRITWKHLPEIEYTETPENKDETTIQTEPA